METCVLRIEDNTSRLQSLLLGIKKNGSHSTARMHRPALCLRSHGASDERIHFIAASISVDGLEHSE